MLSMLAGLLGLAAFAAAIVVLIDAFKASTGQGLLSLCVPFYILYYGFARFQHEKKNLILGVMIGAWLLSMALYGASVAAAF